MATTSSPAAGVALPDETFDIPDDPDAVFTAVISKDRVCQRCYSRLRRHTSVPRDKGFDHERVATFITAVNPDSDRLDREFVERVTVPDALDEAYGEVAEGTTTCCATCGTLEPHRSPPTRSRKDARRHAINLSSTLQALGVCHDWLFLVGLVDELKTRPAYAGNDFETFRDAVSRSVEKARNIRDREE